MAGDDGDFKGKVVLITGAATAIGRATAVAFEERGARLVLGDIATGAKETVDLFRSSGAQAEFVLTDVVDGGQTAH